MNRHFSLFPYALIVRTTLYLVFDDNVDNIKDILLDNAIKTKGIKQMMNNFIKLVCGY